MTASEAAADRGAPHRVAVLALDDVSVFDLATPIEVFGRTTRSDGRPAYDVFVAGPGRAARAGPVELSVPRTLEDLVRADTVIVPGRSTPDVPPPAEAIEALRAAAARGARIASICIGAYDLAATGLLDGLRATIHWRHVRRLALRHPQIEVDGAALYVDNGRLLTSAGAAAGIDLCLHLVAQDFGGAVAAESARVAVVQLVRPAEQAQFLEDSDPGAGGLGATLDWIEQHAAEPVGVAEIAAASTMSVRTLNRRFAREIGVSPGAWLIRSRVRRAQALLAATEWPMERIAVATGLGSGSNLRARFIAVVGLTPSRYRAVARTSGRAAARPYAGPARSGEDPGRR